MNYYPFHLGDYAAHTAHLEPMEDLAYRRMLDLYYRTEAPLPECKEEIARLIRMKAHTAEISDVLKEFFTLTADGWQHSRCDGEIATFKAMAEGGRKGAAKRWAKGGDSPPIAPPSLPQCQPEPEPEPKEKTNTARKRAAPAVLVSVSEMVAEGVSEQHATDWLIARKAKDLPLTPTAWDQTKAEAVKAGMTVPDAIKTAAANGWAGFKAAWLEQGSTHRGFDPPKTVPSAAADATAAYLAEQSQRGATAPPRAVLEALRALKVAHG